MSRAVRHPASLFSIALLVIAVPIAVRLALRNSAIAASDGGTSTVSLEVALLRAGLDADALAAAGLTSQQATATLSAFEGAVSAAPEALSAADVALASARQQADTLQRKIKSGLATEQEVQAYAQAKAALTSAEAARDAVLNGLFGAAVAGLPDEKATTLTTIRSNRHWKLPVEFLVKQRTEAEWVSLRDSLSDERTAIKRGWVAPSQTSQTLLATARADSAVAAAKSQHEANLATLQSVWSSVATQ